MSWNDYKADLVKSRWQAAYYGEVMSLLRHIESNGQDVYGISASRAGHIADIVEKYASVSEVDVKDPTWQMTIHVSMFPKEDRDVGALMAYAMGGGVPSWDVPDADSDEIARYFNVVAERSRAYYTKRDADRLAAKEAAERERQERAAERKRKREREDVLLQRIRDYVAECETSGVKPVKKRMVDDEFTQNVVSKVWKRFDAERPGNGA